MPELTHTVWAAIATKKPKQFHEVLVHAQRFYDAREAARRHLGLPTYDGLQLIRDAATERPSEYLRDGDTLIDVRWEGRSQFIDEYIYAKEEWVPK